LTVVRFKMPLKVIFNGAIIKTMSCMAAPAKWHRC
jgi:hypothetical protein